MSETHEAIEARMKWLVGYAFMQSHGRGFTTGPIEEERYQKDIKAGRLLPEMTPLELAAYTSRSQSLAEIAAERQVESSAIVQLADAVIAMDSTAPLPKCQCPGHRMAGVHHVVACCAEPHVKEALTEDPR